MHESKRWSTSPPDELFTEEFLHANGVEYEIEVDRFAVRWKEKYWKNTPGPFYSTISNMMSLLASSDAPSHLFYDERCEFVWRPPCTENEYVDCITAMWCDEADSYGIDGNEHWTPPLVAEWWERRGELIDWAQGLQTSVSENERTSWDPSVDISLRSMLTQYIDFIENESEEYLRSYVFLLLEGRPARDGDRLPIIGG